MKSVLKNTGLLFTLLFALITSAQEVKLPFELSKDNKSIFIKLPMENQKDSLVFFFDTGAATTLLDKKVADKYNLKANHKTEVGGAGGKKVYDVLTNQKIFLDRNSHVETNIVFDDLSRLSTLYDRNFDGIIGAAILKKYLTKFDFETHTMYLYKFGEPLDNTGYEKIDFEFYSGGIPRFPITFELKNKEKFSGDILFDSGASLSLLVNAPYKEKNNLLSKMSRKITYSSSNLSNKTNYSKGLIESLQLGNTRIEHKNLGILFSSDKQGVSSENGLLGILGSEIINRFNFILDYKNKKLYLKPNSLFHNEFEMPINPISLKYSDDRNEIRISSVMENTDAYEKGLKENQTIISINNIASNDIETYRQLLNQKNKKVIIKYMDSDNKIKTVKFKLKELL
ncbi:aspartyl protease family protein [Elizabethkingia ursingii]|uniref:aspartyl protease family protein n=1 Tax=Elizabethkingia ursingii TaxID=1756150 RepID=UPI002010DB14|nr:aspartyl protease family protein [Elizabethkingia ursingii]MCL1670027.1 aspartyl protease family protein [Elizabethkingia ursingii]